MRKGKIIALIGISGSGKTTRAKELLAARDNAVTLSRDKVRELLFGGFDGVGHTEYYAQDKNVISTREKIVTEVIEQLIWKFIKEGRDVILDNTHLEMKYLNRLKEFRTTIEYEILDTDLNTCIERDKNRDKSVGEKVIEKQHKQLVNLLKQFIPNGLPGKKGKLIKFYADGDIMWNPDLPHAFIFDIDGTLAEKGDRNPYDWKRVKEDAPREHVVEVLRSLHESAYNIILCTGRDGSAQKLTEEWLDENNIPYNHLLIREEGNTEKDWIIKERMWREISKSYYIVGAFDDRLQVVRRLHELGIPVFNVNDGLIEF